MVEIYPEDFKCGGCGVCEGCLFEKAKVNLLEVFGSEQSADLKNAFKNWIVGKEFDLTATQNAFIAFKAGFHEGFYTGRHT